MIIINNIFSIFDPSSSYASINWLIIIIPFVIFNSSIENSNSNTNKTINTLNIFISKEINQIVENNLNTTNAMFNTIFILILVINISAIFPYNFTLTAHISISFTLGFTMWIATIIFGWNNQFNNIINHLTPLGTPNALINFIVIIETISAIIRPITLSIRLSANIVAGHLLISLLSTFSIISTNNTIVCIVPTALLIILEIGVAIVQAYVLMTLLLLYQNETS